MQNNNILNTFEITIPLRSISYKQKITLSPQDFSLTCEMDSNLLKTHYPISLYSRNIQISSNSIKLTDFTQANAKSIKNKSNQSKSDILHIQTDQNDSSNPKKLLYRNYQCTLKNNLLHFTFSNDEIRLTLQKVEKPKFIKNEYLDSLLSPQKQNSEYGLLSMDQLGRVMVQRQDCQYPVIGIWYCSQQINHVLVYSHLSQYIESKSNALSKCIFKYGKRYFIYFAHIQTNKNIPQLYLVHWQKPEQQLKMVKKVIKNSEVIKIDFNQENEEDEVLEFTLRNKSENQTPVKFLDNIELQHKLEQVSFPNSPVFSSIKKPLYSTQDCSNCERLLQKIDSQQSQITQMRTQIKKLSTQLFQLKQCLSSPSKKPFLLIKSPLYNVQDSAPKTNLKKLTQSDLRVSDFKLNSASTREKKSSFQNSGNSHSKKLRKYFIEEQDDPWDNIQIIE